MNAILRVMRPRLSHKSRIITVKEALIHRSFLVDSFPTENSQGMCEIRCALASSSSRSTSSNILSCKRIQYHSHNNAICCLSQQKVLVPHHSSVQNLLLNLSMSPQEIIIRHLQTDSQQNTSKKGTEQISLWKRAIIVATVGGLVWFSFRNVNTQKGIDEEKVRYDEFKKAEIGGDWLLTDQDGKRRSSTELRGQWILMYFGFSHCPDICPEELEKLIKIVKKFDGDTSLPNMLPVFITLDPERDTPPVIKDYLADLKYPRMLGFTGTVEEISKVAKQFRAYFKKGPVDEDNDYIVDHTIVIYLINPKGEFVNYYDRSRTDEIIFRSVSEHVKKYLGMGKTQ